MCCGVYWTNQDKLYTPGVWGCVLPFSTAQAQARAMCLNFGSNYSHHKLTSGSRSVITQTTTLISSDNLRNLLELFLRYYIITQSRRIFLAGHYNQRHKAGTRKLGEIALNTFLPTVGKGEYFELFE